MSTFSRSLMSLQLLAPNSGSPHNQQHELNSSVDHGGLLPEDKVAFYPISGHDHNGINSTRLLHSALLGNGQYTHPQLDSHLDSHLNPHQVTANQVGAISVNKLIAVPQTEQSVGIVNSTVYQIQANNPIFVGRTTGTDPNALICLLELDGTRLLANGIQVTIAKITSDLAGNNSVVGFGYYAKPYLHLSVAPNKILRLRYGIEGSLGTVPESLLLNEPLWVGETQADVKGWLSEIKGQAYDATIASNESLKGVVERIATIEKEINVTTSANILFKNSIISGINTSLENDQINESKIAGIHENKIIDGAIFPRLANNETIDGKWQFNNGPIIEHGIAFPVQTEEGRLFVKTDTRTLYVANGLSWQKASTPPRHIRFVGNDIIQQWLVPNAVAGTESIWVFRNMLLQDKEMGQYSESQEGADVRISFSSPIPSGVVIVVKVF